MYFLGRIRKSFLLRVCLTLTLVSLLWLHLGVFIYRGAEIDYENRYVYHYTLLHIKVYSLALVPCHAWCICVGVNIFAVYYTLFPNGDGFVSFCTSPIIPGIFLHMYPHLGLKMEHFY